MRHSDGDAPRVTGVPPVSLAGATAPTVETTVAPCPRPREVRSQEGPVVSRGGAVASSCARRRSTAGAMNRAPAWHLINGGGMPGGSGLQDRVVVRVGGLSSPPQSPPAPGRSPWRQRPMAPSPLTPATTSSRGSNASAPTLTAPGMQVLLTHPCAHSTDGASPLRRAHRPPARAPSQPHLRRRKKGIPCSARYHLPATKKSSSAHNSGGTHAYPSGSLFTTTHHTSACAAPGPAGSRCKRRRIRR